MPPSEWEEEHWEAQDVDASAVPPDVAENMRQFVRALTTPESELEQQVLEVVQRWAARHAAQPSAPAGGDASAGPAALAAPGAPCAQGGSASSPSHSNSPSWSGGSSSDAAPAPAPAVAADAPGSSGRSSSEEGSSAAWRLCTFLQRSGWPVQHCASVRTGSGGSGGGTGWRFSSGHEFLLLFPRQGGGGGGGGPGALPANSCCSDGSSSGGDGDMPDAAAALVIDPDFSTQFALASPSPRYQVVLSLLPRVFVGTYTRLQRLVEWVCGEMRGCFRPGEGGLPPWRSTAHMLNKWRVAVEEEEKEGMDAEQATQPALGWRQVAGSAPPSTTAAAFTAQQQESMRALLLHPAAAPVPAAQLALTASSSCSSMDVVPAPPAGGAPASTGATTPRSLLTQELHAAAAAAGAKRHHVHQQGPPPQRQHLQGGDQPQEGPAAAILSLLGRARGGQSA